MFKDLIGWTKSAGKFLVRNNISASLIFTYLITPAIGWLGARLLGLNQGTVLISLSIGMLIGLGFGLWLGWQLRARKAKSDTILRESKRESELGGIRYVAIGKYDQDLEDLQQSGSLATSTITAFPIGGVS